MGLIKQSKGFEMELVDVNYKFIGVSEDSPKDFDFIVSDDYEIDGFNDEIVGITLTRKVYYKPEMFFNISVKLRIIYDVGEEKNKELNKVNLEKELDAKKKMLLNPIVSRASLLIANITNADDNLNVITPPFLQTGKEK